ncbi:hypothetical protein LRS10_13725 [Phenylobacterium sp. J426]|uniref:hypothetical protein n=1 Tax=Phenylobacterium sp. J426 TaxID=2898439 RepID=UPI00215196EC|nr:hypothetical protein [Phenylobacterium sp. J426]MCR5875153.1 hypothetical protein [Phenylobacterium sp. J426]
MLSARDQKIFKLGDELVRLRRFATEDVEVAAPDNEGRRQDIMLAALDFELALDRAFVKKYG